MTLNHIFLFLAIVSPLLVLVHAWRPGAVYHGWGPAAVVVLAITAVAWLFSRAVAGYVGGFAWVLLLFLPAIGLRKMAQLATQGDYRTAAKIGGALLVLHPTSELRQQVRAFRQLESNPAPPKRVGPVAAERGTGSSVRAIEFRSAPAVFVLILLNVLVFLFEIFVGDWNDPEVLHGIGALEPYAVVAQHEYWRLFTALFLHAGFLHLGFNVFALYVLGPPLERAIGTMRFAACYLLSGLASSAGVVALSVLGIVQVAEVIGASGCIMGIVGAWAGFLLHHRHAPLAKQRLGNIGLIIAIQIAFDLSTPQVSMSAHLCGLIAGLLLGLILTKPAIATRISPDRR